MYITELWEDRRPSKALRQAMRACPDYVFIEIGSNDATQVTPGTAEALGKTISDMLRWISLQPHVKGLVWGAILMRRPDIRENILPRARYDFKVDLAMFNACRLTINDTVRHTTCMPVRVCEHSRFENRRGDGLAEDGVHVTDASMRHYWWSVRGALLQILKQSEQGE